MFTAGTEEYSKSSKTSICAFYLKCSCTKGQKCAYLHDIPEERYNIEPKSSGREDLCYFFLKGRCNDGENCNRSHEEPPCFNGVIKKVCIYFSQGRCNRGKLCSYTHALPNNYVPANITAYPQSSVNINEVPQLLINTSDDVQSMADMPKLCRFSRRGMCFFGDRCTSFHDKPEKDLDAFLSDLRKDEALKERNSLNEIKSCSEREKNSNNRSLIVKNKETDFNSLREVQRSSNSGCQPVNNRRATHRVEKSSSKSEELPTVPSSESKKPFRVSLNNLIKDPRSSSNSKEFDRPSNSSSNSKKLEKDIYSSSKLKKIARASSSSLNSKVYPRDAYGSSHSKEYSSYRSSNTSEFTSASNSSPYSEEYQRDANRSSHSKEYSNYRSSNTREFTSASNDSSNSEEYVRGAYSSSNSTEFVRKANSSSKLKEFTKRTCSSHLRESIKDPCSSSNSKEHSRSRFTFNDKPLELSKSKKFSNDSSGDAKLRDFVRAPFNSKSKEYAGFRSAGNYSMANEQFRNTDNPLESRQQYSKADASSQLKKQSRLLDNSLKSKTIIKVDLQLNKTEVSFYATNMPSSSNGQSKVVRDSELKTQFPITDGFITQTEPRTNRSMTRKQSKSQRKIKDGRIHSRVILREVTHVTKKFK